MFENFKDLADERGEHIPAFGFRIYAYYNDQGMLAYTLDIDEEENSPTPITTLIGVVEMAKAEIVSTAIQFGRPR